jgi:hypothetical protein
VHPDTAGSHDGAARLVYPPLTRATGSDGAMRAIATAIRDQFRKWRGQYQAWRARYREQQRQPAGFSLIAVERGTAVAKWLVGLNGAATVLAYTLHTQSFLSILSIKSDCVSQRFVADAISQAASFAGLFLVSGMLALFAIALPAALGIGRNLLRWMKAHKEPPLQPGHEFDGWSDYQVTGRVTIWQWILVIFSSVLFFGLTFFLVFSEIGMTPERVWQHWHKFELQCLPQPPDQGVS